MESGRRRWWRGECEGWRGLWWGVENALPPTGVQSCSYGSRLLSHPLIRQQVRGSICLPCLPSHPTATFSSICRHVLAVGLESGQILLHYCRLSPLEWNLATALNPSLCHTSVVKQLSWRPPSQKKEDQPQKEHTLASCSHDNSVKLFKVTFSKWQLIIHVYCFCTIILNYL